MTAYEKLQRSLLRDPKTWLVTGAAGFIGSHLVQKLLELNQQVLGLDNFATGHRANLANVRQQVGAAAWKHFKFLQGDIRQPKTCQRACQGMDYVLHQAALGSVPRSVEDPLASNEFNVTGFLNVLIAARDSKVRRMVYASSSAVYGDAQGLPKVEEKIGRPLSPYAVTKYVNEVYASVFARCYQLESIGLRYFNVFGPRQDPDGPYAAVIPKWLAAMQAGEPIFINGDGKTSRDFCYIANVVQANLLAATTPRLKEGCSVANIACHERTTLNDLFNTLRAALQDRYPHLERLKPKYQPFRAGDVRHSLASIDHAQALFGYTPTHSFADGVRETVAYLA